jgi:hypothetical protein
VSGDADAETFKAFEAAELRRVLAPDGRMALAVWDVPERVGILGPLAEALRAADA